MCKFCRADDCHWPTYNVGTEKLKLLKLVNAYHIHHDIIEIKFGITKSLSHYQINEMEIGDLKRMIHGMLGDMIYDIMDMQRKIIEGEQV